MNAELSKQPRAVLCSICGHPAVTEFRPFCSARCANVDLSRWLGGVYTVAGSVSGDDEEDSAPNLPAPDRNAED